MRDTVRLRGHIARALLLFPLAATLAACANEDPKPASPVDVPVTGSATSASPIASAAAETASPAHADPPVAPRSNPMPTCPEGKFCAPKSTMAQYGAPSSPQVLGCPTMLEPQINPKAKLPDGMPAGARAHTLFSETDTKAARQDAGSAGEACCYGWFEICSGGRPLMADGASVLAPARAGSSWSRRERELGADLDAQARGRLASAWLTDALSEHASVASFARTTLELMAVGAPIELVSECSRATLDEVRHAERCFEVARAYGAAFEPGPLPALAPRATNLARLARDTFTEGCVGETISALAAMRAQENAPDTLASTWKMLATDESRHAALAWKTLAWILGQKHGDFGGEMLAFAEEELARTTALHARRDVGDEPALEGRLSVRQGIALTQQAWREIIMPTLRAMVEARTAAA